MHDALTEALQHDPAKDDELILVDGLDRQIGTATKVQAHTQGLLHRAFSVVLWREGQDERELLIARRAPGKYHSAGLWGNSCCSHPRAGEKLMDAALRRVPEELGVAVDELTEIGSFVYRAEFGDGLAEYEYDHVLLACADVDPCPSPQEVDAVRWVPMSELAVSLANEHELYAPWAMSVLPMAMAHLQ